MSKTPTWKATKDDGPAARVYGYIRVSSDRQTVENQRFEVNKFCEGKGIKIDGWIAETISGTKNYDKRELGKLLKHVKNGDLIICSELSRLGRNLFMIMEILSICMKKGCKVWTIKDGYRLGDDIQSKVLAFAFGLSAEIERNLIAQRTREALARLRAEGKTLGRPVGAKDGIEKTPLWPKRERVYRMLSQGCSKRGIAAKLKVGRDTVRRFVNRMEEEGIPPWPPVAPESPQDCVQDAPEASDV